MSGKTEDEMSVRNSLINWEQLEADSARFAADATSLSQRLEKAQAKLRTLPGKFAVKYRSKETGEQFKFDRAGSIWALFIWRSGGWAALHNMSVEEKAQMASDLSGFLQHLCAEGSRLANVVATGLEDLGDAEALLGDLEEEGE